MSTIQTKRVLTLKDFKAEVKAPKLDLVKSDRTGKVYAKSGDNIVATVSKDIDLTKEVEVLDMVDTDTGETWFFVKNVTSYTALGSL
jgi:hypothetical protein